MQWENNTINTHLEEMKKCFYCNTINARFIRWNIVLTSYVVMLF